MGAVANAEYDERKVLQVLDLPDGFSAVDVGPGCRLMWKRDPETRRWVVRVDPVYEPGTLKAFAINEDAEQGTVH